MNESIFNYAKRLVKHSSIYGLGTILHRAVAIVLLPLYTDYLSPDKYGDLDLFFITSTFLFMIMQFGMGSAIFRSIIYKTNSHPGTILTTAFFFLIGINSIVVFLLCLLAEPLSRAIFETSDYASLLQILFFTDFFLVMTDLAQTKLRIDERSTLFAFISLGNFVVGLILTILFLAVMKWGIAGILWAQLITSVIFTFVNLSVIFKDFQLKFSFHDLIEMLDFGLPMVPASLAIIVLMLSSRYFLKHLGSDADEVGVFAVGYRVAQVISLTVNAFQLAWPTLLFTIAKGENAQNTFSKILNYLVFVMVTFSLAISVFSRELVLLFTQPKYLDAHLVIPLIAFANILWGIFYVTCIGIQLKKKTMYIAIITGIAAVLSLGLNYWLISIPGFSLMGAAVAGIIANLLVVVPILLISLHLYYIHYEYGKILFFTLLAIATYFAGTLIPTEKLVVVLLAKTGLMSLFLIIVYFSNYFSSNEIEKIKQFIKEAVTLITSRIQRS